MDKMLENQQSNMLVKMIIGIGKFSGMKVVAEGVETKEQFQRIIAYECDLAQGYYFDHPLTIKQLSQRYHRSHEILVNYL
ncbi:EAL domain-containing protein [Vibrio sp. PP-XX7]